MDNIKKSNDSTGLSIEVYSLLSKLIEVYSHPFISLNFKDFLFKKDRELLLKKQMEIKVGALKELGESGLDPAILERYLNSEVDRRLKEKFGKLFFLFTAIFTLLSMGIVALNYTLGWGIPDFAITALVIEIPIQFLGILWIIAKSLFPTKK